VTIESEFLIKVSSARMSDPAPTSPDSILNSSEYF
jgi:hypothetical protein